MGLCRQNRCIVCTFLQMHLWYSRNLLMNLINFILYKDSHGLDLISLLITSIVVIIWLRGYQTRPIIPICPVVYCGTNGLVIRPLNELKITDGPQNIIVNDESSIVGLRNDLEENKVLLIKFVTDAKFSK